MRRLLLIALLILLASAAIAANYYLPPTQNTLTDSALFAVYPNRSGARGMTWGEMKRQTSIYAHSTSSWRISNATQIYNLMTSANAAKLIKRAASNATTYQRLFEIKDSTGKIVYWVNNSGQMIVGTPLALAVTGVYPANGATGVSNGVWFNYSSTSGGYDYWGWKGRVVPYVTYNKPATVTISTQYIVGSSIAPTSGVASPAFNSFSGAAGTTYTMRSIRQSIVQEDGETVSSCGTAMTDIAGYCQSTFTMR